MSKFLVDCFLPVYNAARFIDRWWEKNFSELQKVSARIVVVDNGSQDATLRLIEARLTPEVQLIKHGENLGIEASFRSAKKVMNAKYRILLPADDWLAEGYLREALKVYESDTEVRAVYGNGYMFDESSQVITERPRPLRPMGIFKESPFSPILFNNYIPDIGLYRSGDLCSDVASSDWFPRGGQSCLLAGGSVYYTGKPQCYSGKRPDQLSKEWADDGRYFSFFENIFRDFGRSISLLPEEQAFLFLVHNNFYTGVSLLSGYLTAAQSGHPYVKGALRLHEQAILYMIAMALVDELAFLSKSSLRLRDRGRLGTAQEFNATIRMLTLESRSKVQATLRSRGLLGALS